MLAVAAFVATPEIALAEAAVPVAAKPAYTTAHTTIEVLFADPAAKAVVAKFIPTLMAKEWINDVNDMTLEQLLLWAPELVNEKVLADIDGDLAKLAPKK
jgi:hypothetical protein